MEKEGLKIKSPCLGELSIIELAKFAIIIGSVWLAFSVFYAQHKDIPNRMGKAETNISEVKEDISSISTKVETISDDVKIIKQHILRKK